MTTLIEVPEAPPLLAGRYLLGAPIGVGGGATVHRALDTRLGVAVAVKRPRSVEAHARLRDEAALLARCAHPGLAACLDVGEDEGGAPYLVLALVDGVNLVQIAEGTPLPRAIARAWAREVARTVAHLHARGVAHGDLKAQHVVVDGRGRAVLVDLDHARAATPDAVAADRRSLARTVRWLRSRSRA